MSEQTASQTLGLRQKVLPERIAVAIDDSHYMIRRPAREKMRNMNWIAYEANRESSNLPYLNIFVPGSNRAAILIAGTIEGKVRKIINLLGYGATDLLPVNVYIDPATIYSKSDPQAFINRRSKDIWVKTANKGSGLDHELAHWATQCFNDSEQLNTLNGNALAYEGIATWISWQIKTEAERKASPQEDYDKLMNGSQYAYAFPENKLSVDMEIDDTPAMYFGAVLFDKIYLALGKDALKLGQALKTVNKFRKFSQWISSLGLSVSDIEQSWKKRIYHHQG